MKMAENNNQSTIGNGKERNGKITNQQKHEKNE